MALQRDGVGIRKLRVVILEPDTLLLMILLVLRSIWDRYEAGWK